MLATDGVYKECGLPCFQGMHLRQRHNKQV